MRIPVVPKSLEQLSKLANPQAVAGGQSEALRWTLYDTQSVIAAASPSINYFAATNQDRSLSNMQTGGQLPDPQFFELFYVSVDPIIAPQVSAAGAATGSWTDMWQLMVGSRSTWTFSLSDKTYGPFPLTFFHASGGQNGFGISEGVVAGINIEYANNGVFDGGYSIDGGIVIPPNTNFGVQIQFGVPPVLTAATLLRVNLDGVLHRRVL